MDAEEAHPSAEHLSPPVQISPDLSRFIENMGLHFEGYDVPRIGGRILGLLLTSPQPVSSEEMADALQVSRSSISTNLRTLLLSSLVEKVSLPGERVDYYQFSDQAWQHALELRLSGVFDLKGLGEQALQCLDAGHPARPRLEEMLAWVSLVENMLAQITLQWQSRREAV